MAKPSCGELAEDVLDGFDEGALKISEGEVERPGMFADSGANMSRRESIKSVDVDLVVDCRSERSNKVMKNVL